MLEVEHSSTRHAWTCRPGRLWNCEFFRNFPYSECFPFPGISPIPRMLHGPVTVSAPGARIRIGRVRRKHMIYSVCRFSTDPFAKNHECHADPQPSPNRQSSACDMVHAHLTRTHKFQDSTKLTSERLLRLRRARTSSPRMTDGKNGGLGVVNLYGKTGFVGLCLWMGGGGPDP